MGAPTLRKPEYVDWADTILEKSLEIEDSHVSVPGAGEIRISWDEAAVQRYSVGEP